MKKALMIASVLLVAVISTACINNIAVQELNNKAAEYMQKGDYESAMNRLQASLDLDSTMYSLGVAQADLADELVEVTEDKKEITEEDKLKAVEFKKSAVENLTKYLELNPTTEDKKTIEELIEESNSFINGDDNSAKEDAE